MKIKFTPYATLVGFNSRKAAQLCAWFASKSSSGIAKLKLIKLVYLAERENLALYGQPMLFDEMFSLEHGPVCSNTLNGINECNDLPIWKQFISLTDRTVKAVKPFDPDIYDDMSPADLEVLETTWSSFGHMTSSQIRNYTHKFCPEYTEVTSGRIEIDYKDIFRALGDAEIEAEAQSESIKAYRRAEAVLRA